MASPFQQKRHAGHAYPSDTEKVEARQGTDGRDCLFMLEHVCDYSIAAMRTQGVKGRERLKCENDMPCRIW